MEKAERLERKRRRRERLQQQGSGEDATGAEPAEAPSDQNPEASSYDAAENISSSDDLGMDSAELGTRTDAAAAAARPAAMAEVIGSSLSKDMRGANEEAAPSDVDPFFQRAMPRTKFAATEPTRPTAESRTMGAASPAGPEPSQTAEPQPELPPMREMTPRPQPPVRSSTSDSVLRALLLAALVVLAIDTYFIVRMNGVFDRLNATAAKPAASSTASATGRPWIGIGSIKTAPFANGGQPVTTVRFGNSGSEPAYDFRSNTVGSLRPAGSPPPDIPAQKGPVASAGVLVPNAEGILTFFANTRALTADEAGRVRSGQLVLWLAGRLDYRDAHGKQHLTAFRYQYNPSLNSFVAAAQGNSAN